MNRGTLEWKRVRALESRREFAAWVRRFGRLCDMAKRWRAYYHADRRRYLSAKRGARYAAMRRAAS